MKSLLESIEHWEEVVANPFTTRTNNAACALCNEFYFGKHFCVGCPVYIKTGLSFCKGTPYYAYAYAKTDMLNGLIDMNEDYLRALALEELNFLRGLL